MKSRAMIDQILAMHQSGHPIRKISKALGISRNTVRRYLRQADDPGATVLPPAKITARAVGPAWAAGLDWEGIVKAKRRGVTSAQLFVEHEPPVGYSRFCHYLRQHLHSPVKPAIKLDHIPGERTQIDYTDGVWIIDPKTGSKKKSQLFCGVLPFSSLTFAEFTTDQKLSSFIRSQETMWAYFGGVTPYVVIDNLKSGVSRAHRYDPELNPTYCDYANHTGFAVLPARPYTPRDKAAVEAAIGVLQRVFYQRHRHTAFYSLAEANAALRVYLNELNNKVMVDHGVSRRERFSLERERLMPLPSESYELAEWRKAKVHPDCCIQIQGGLYSVPFRYCGTTVRVKVRVKLIEIYDNDQNQLACHVRVNGRARSIVEEHLPPTRVQASSFEIKKVKAQATAIGPNTERLVDELLSGARPLRYLRRTQGIIRLLSSNFTVNALEYGCAQAITYKRTHLSYIKSCAERYRDTGGKLVMVTTPLRDPATIHLHGG